MFVSGFAGIYCENNKDDCGGRLGGHLCQNGGQCIDGVNSYTCDCPPQYTGQYCTEDVDECATNENICQNGATCANKFGSYSCICVNG